MQPHIRILIVDDHPAIRRGVAATLTPERDMEVTGFAANRQQAYEVWREKRPDITLMDLALEGGTGGVQAIRQIRQEFPTAKVIVFSAFASVEEVYQALQAGAVSFLTKDAADAELVGTIRAVHAGKRPLSPEIAQKLADRIREPDLTSREVEVLTYLARGLRNKEIATVLRISEQTTQTHLRNIYAKLRVNDRTSAAFIAAQHGIIRVHQTFGDIPGLGETGLGRTLA
jgi:DNA-binding NarL/FixJ family response regulator